MFFSGASVICMWGRFWAGNDRKFISKKAYPRCVFTQCQQNQSHYQWQSTHTFGTNLGCMYRFKIINVQIKHENDEVDYLWNTTQDVGISKGHASYLTRIKSMEVQGNASQGTRKGQILADGLQHSSTVVLLRSQQPLCDNCMKSVPPQLFIRRGSKSREIF